MYSPIRNPNKIIFNRLYKQLTNTDDKITDENFDERCKKINSDYKKLHKNPGSLYEIGFLTKYHQLTYDKDLSMLSLADSDYNPKNVDQVIAKYYYERIPAMLDLIEKNKKDFLAITQANSMFEKNQLTDSFFEKHIINQMNKLIENKTIPTPHHSNQLSHKIRPG
jgi:TPP-dependent 2-oxoacid decarboxylase